MKRVLRNVLVCCKAILISITGYAQANITNAEYFFDTDPGFGNASAITISTPATDIASLAFNANVSALTDGMHTLYIRSKNANGIWSITNKLYIAKVKATGGNANTISNISQAEYFFDADPGYGNGTGITVTPGTDISGLAFNANVASLTTGIHTLYIRTKDAQGKWSETQNIYFAKAQPVSGNPNTISNIVKAEYFFNTDPGFGNGTNIPVAAATDINGAVINANIASLPTGLHTIYIRTQDAQGKWSITSKIQFSRIQGLSPNPHQLSRINKAEYFYDADPGYGNGTNIPVAPSFDISSLTFNADVSTLINGVHTMYVRTRDSLGQWSEVNKFYFVKVQPLANNPNTLSNIVKAEYYYDTDPGFDAGTNIPVVAGNTISSLTFNANVNTLTNGVHTLYVRSKDADNKWSIVNKVIFAKVQPLSGNPHTISNITQVEYFVDTDPGIGNGLQIPITATTDISNISFNVNMALLVNGAHNLYIRTKDAQGKWSITNIHSFNGGTAPLAIKLISFEARLLQDKKVMLEWVTAEENNVARYIIERSYDAADWQYLGEKLPVAATSKEKHYYQLRDEHPGTGIIYYRLTEIDLNGNKTQAPVRFVKISEAANDVATLYPNPNDGKQVSISSSVFSEGEVTITIISVDGKIHLKQVVNDPGSAIVTLSNLQLAQGNYFINLQSKTKTQSLKLLVAGEQF